MKHDLGVSQGTALDSSVLFHITHSVRTQCARFQLQGNLKAAVRNFIQIRFKYKYAPYGREVMQKPPVIQTL